MYIQGVGWPLPQRASACVGTLAGGAVLMFELDGPRVAYAWGINARATSRWRGA